MDDESAGQLVGFGLSFRGVNGYEIIEGLFKIIGGQYKMIVN